MKKIFVCLALVVHGAGSAAGGVGHAQQKVPFRNNIPVAPSGIPALPLPDAPVVYDTAEGQKIRVSVVVRGLANPWSLAWLPDGSMLVTERPGRLRVIRKGVLDPKPVKGLPAIHAAGLNGLMEVALHPQFASNSLVYLSYAKQVSAGPPVVTTLAVARGRWNGTALVDTKEIFNAGPGVNGPARMTFGRDGMLYVTTGGVNGPDAQDPNSLAGKVLRLKDDGTVPADNPFAGKANHRAEVYTIGHRSSLGLAVHPGTGPGVAARERAQRRRRDQHPEAGRPTTAGRSSASGARIPDHGSPTSSRARASRRRSCSGCRRSPRRASRSTPATGCRSGRATCSWAACAPARCRAPAISSASCSTRRWRSCAASRCSYRCASGSATCGRARMACSTWSPTRPPTAPSSASSLPSNAARFTRSLDVRPLRPERACPGRAGSRAAGVGARSDGRAPDAHRAWNPRSTPSSACCRPRRAAPWRARPTRRRARRAAGPLHGLPIAFKDLQEAAGLPFTRGSPIYRDAVGQADTVVVERLRGAGALAIGKTNVPEFGLGSHTYNPVWGTTRNPYDLSRSAGGSSGGAGAALATGMLPIADGSDLGGSLRNPANFNNVVALRPSVGLVPTAPDRFPASASA